jgi:hypothetical protein
MTLVRSGEERDPGFVPPEVAIVSAKQSPNVLMARIFGSATLEAPLSDRDVLYWRNDNL